MTQLAEPTESESESDTDALDRNMQLRIGQLLDRAITIAHRFIRCGALISPEKLETPRGRKLMRRINKRIHAFRDAIARRADEVVTYCDRIGFDGCTAAWVRDDPIDVLFTINDFLLMRKR